MMPLGGKKSRMFTRRRVGRVDSQSIGSNPGTNWTKPQKDKARLGFKSTMEAPYIWALLRDSHIFHLGCNVAPGKQKVPCTDRDVGLGGYF